MAERTRMFKTLGCLCVAMAGGAVLLAWLEPVEMATADGFDPAAARKQVVDALSLDRGVRPVQWRVIEITPARAERSIDRRRLAAEGVLHHFSVSEMGIVKAQSSWRRQQLPAQDMAAVVVTVEGIRSNTTVASVQWQGLRALLGDLSDRFASDEGIQIRLNESLGSEFPDWARSLRKHLADDGYRPDGPKS